MKPIRLETEVRYYIIKKEIDLLGDHVVRCEFGSKFTRRGNHKIHIAKNDSEADQIIENIIKIRTKRGYELI